VVLLDGRELDAHARRAAASVTAHEQSVHAAEADRAAAEAALITVRATHARVRQLHDARAATPRELDEAIGALRAADAHHQAATARVHAAESALIVSRETAGAAAITASYATVTAPFDGVVTETLVDPGDLAAPGTPLARIEDVRALRLEVQVDEAQASVIDRAAPVEIAIGPSALDAGESITLTGRVIEVSRSADAGVHAFLVKVEVPANAGVSTGSFARARFTAPPRQVLAVPASAIVERGQLPTVFVITSGHARMRVVRVGVSGAHVEILAGLADGEQVVTSPPPSLRDGDRVAPAPVPGGA
jgi:RND family efflux transporter MFP subunit